MSTDDELKESAARKKPYRSPRLTVHGNVRRLTKLTGPKGGNKNDGGGFPKTRQ